MRRTIKNPNGSFRVPEGRIGEFRFLGNGPTSALHGDLIDLLGQYEDAGDPEELKRAMDYCISHGIMTKK